MNSLRIRIALLIVLTAGLGSGCSLFGGRSPTGTFKAFFEGWKKNDLAAMKSRVSTGSIAFVQRMAQAENKPLDQWVQENSQSADAANEPMPELRNEKIDGDRATLEVKPAKAKDWISLPFVKEGGEWKIAFDEMLGGGGRGPVPPR
jgi:hypothetical protein